MNSNSGIEHEYLREDHRLRSSDCRKAFDVSSPTMTQFYKKHNIKVKGASRSHYLDWDDARKVFTARGYEYPIDKVIAIAVGKGGTAKTTTTYYTAHRLVQYGHKVLVVDSDPQGNVSQEFLKGLEEEYLNDQTIILSDILAPTPEHSIEDGIIELTENLHLFASTDLNNDLDNIIRKAIEKGKSPETIFSKQLKKIAGKYNFIIIDCAPTLNVVNTAMIGSSDLVVLPINPDNLSFASLNKTMNHLDEMEDYWERTINRKILFTRTDRREYATLNKYIHEIATAYPQYLSQTGIGTSSDVRKAMMKNEDLFSYSSSSAKRDYDAFTLELMAEFNGGNLFKSKTKKLKKPF